MTKGLGCAMKKKCQRLDGFSHHDLRVACRRQWHAHEDNFGHRSQLRVAGRADRLALTLCINLCVVKVVDARIEALAHEVLGLHAERTSHHLWC